MMANDAPLVANAAAHALPMQQRTMHAVQADPLESESNMLLQCFAQAI
jgi:hypothetical protein